MFSMELQLISFVSNPKGGNQALSIRIRGQQVFNLLLTTSNGAFVTSNGALVLDFRRDYAPDPRLSTRLCVRS